jgi:trimethylamine:corrinoid methyltransferase-like protein
MLFCQRRTYLESEHTRRHFREVGWYPRLLERTYCDHTRPAPAGDEALLRRADQAWRSLVAAQAPLEVEPAMARQLDQIVEAARKELLADGPAAA